MPLSCPTVPCGPKPSSLVRSVLVAHKTEREAAPTAIINQRHEEIPPVFGASAGLVFQRICAGPVAGQRRGGPFRGPGLRGAGHGRLRVLPSRPVIVAERVRGSRDRQRLGAWPTGTATFPSAGLRTDRLDRPRMERMAGVRRGGRRDGRKRASRGWKRCLHARLSSVSSWPARPGDRTTQRRERLLT